MNTCRYQQHASLMDVIAPPLNPWLRNLGRRNQPARLPAGIRIVRHVDSGQPDGEPSSLPAGQDSGPPASA